MKLKQRLINLVFYAIARLLHATYRYRFYHNELRSEAESMHQTGAFAFGIWHRDSFVGTLAHTYQKFMPLCSRSGDGQMVAFLCSQMKLRPVLGSSSRGGKEARDELVNGVANGWSPAITVDGPKGPPYKTKNGIIDIAKKTGIPIVPVTAVADRYWELGSWDRLRIPKPFAKVAVCYAKPFLVPADVEGERFEACRQMVDDRLMELDAEIERIHQGALGEGAKKSQLSGLRI